MKNSHFLPRRLTAIVAIASTLGSARAQTLLFTRPGDAAGDQTGWAVAFVGDLDADGAEDYAIGAPMDDVVASNAGHVRVYSGRTLQVLYDWRGSGANDRFGSAIVGAGDVDLDGHADVAVGGPEWQQFGDTHYGPGYVSVFSGATGLVLYSLTGAASSGFGQGLASGGDVDGDTIPDLLVGAPHEDVPGVGTNAGRLYVHSGASGALVRTHPGLASWNTMGFAACFLDDVDGDGRSEYMTSEPIAWQICCASNAVHAYDGASGGEIWNDTNFFFSDEPGWAIARIADISGDGVDDVLIGAPQDPGIGCACTGHGFVRAYDATSGSVLYQVNGSGIYAGLGTAIAAMGDVDGSGFEDFAVSQPATEGCSGNTQALQIREGSTGALLLSIPNVSNGSNFGWSLASGDANGDGLRDLIVGAPCTSPFGSLSGSAYVYTIVRRVQAYCEAETNSQGCTPSIAGSGTPSASSPATFAIAAANVLNNKSGLLFYGFKPRRTPFQGGFMCIVAPTVRTPLANSGGNPPPDDCSGILAMDFNARIQSGVDPMLVAGEEVFAQFWSRDPADLSTTNLSDALAFYIEP